MKRKKISHSKTTGWCWESKKKRETGSRKGGEGFSAKVDYQEWSNDSVEGLVSHGTEVTDLTNQSRLGSLREEKVIVRGKDQCRAGTS